MMLAPCCFFTQRVYADNAAIQLFTPRYLPRRRRFTRLFTCCCSLMPAAFSLFAAVCRFRCAMPRDIKDAVSYVTPFSPLRQDADFAIYLRHGGVTRVMMLLMLRHASAIV